MKSQLIDIISVRRAKLVKPTLPPLYWEVFGQLNEHNLFSFKSYSESYLNQIHNARWGHYTSWGCHGCTCTGCSQTDYPGPARGYRAQRAPEELAQVGVVSSAGSPTVAGVVVLQAGASRGSGSSVWTLFFQEGATVSLLSKFFVPLP